MSDLKLIHARHPPPHQDGWRRRGFDYSQVDADLAARMRETASRIWRLTHDAFIQLGRELRTIKSRLKHGQFVAWVEHECGLPIRAAQRAMRAVEMIEKNDKLSYLPPDGLLALVSRPASEPIVAEIIERIEAGAQPTAAEIKRQIAAARHEAKAHVTSTEAQSLSPEEQLAALIGAWERAGRDAREAFLDRIGAVLTTGQVDEAEQQPTVSPKPITASPEQPYGSGLTTPAAIEEAARLQAASPDEPAVAPNAFNNGDHSEALTVSADKVGVENAMPPQIEGREDHPTASQEAVTAVSEPRDDGGYSEVKTRFFDESGIGSTPAPRLACYAKGGSCRYGACVH